MTRAEALSALAVHEAELRAMGATTLALYGSTARDEARPGSDVDVLIDVDHAARFNAFDLMSIKLFLEDTLSAPVDITVRDGLHPRLKQRIERSAVRVF